jgi:hypothetical protein
MGRPPIGKIAMTATERSHRYRQKLRSEPATKPATKPHEVEQPSLPPLSMTAQQKLEAWQRQYQKDLARQFERCVLNEVKRRVDEMILPHWKEKITQAEKLYVHRRGAMDKATFNKIRRALHPDSRNSISDNMLGDAFDTFMSLEKFLLDEKDSPTDFSGLPETWDEWEKAKQATTAARRARRVRGQSSALRRV